MNKMKGISKQITSFPLKDWNGIFKLYLKKEKKQDNADISNLAEMVILHTLKFFYFCCIFQAFHCIILSN